MRKILVLRGGALGDFIVTLPALAALRARWPAAQIELAGNATAAALGVAAGVLDAAHSQHESRWGALFSAEPLPAALADWLGTFDLVLSFWPDPDGAIARHFPRHARQRFLSAAAQPACAPAAAHYCAPLRELGLGCANLDYRLRPWQPAPKQIALHPGSGSPAKNWPQPRWQELCRWLPTAGLGAPAIIFGEAEPADLLRGFGPPWRELPLAALADRLARCRLFIGHDSGVSHLAAACGVPCVLLFGPTDPAVWAPPGPHVRVIRRGPEMNAISVDDVRALL
jgi:ADP-heptose:LPS heptosyltransferase